jgi:hypothetical protein
MKRLILLVLLMSLHAPVSATTANCFYDSTSPDNNFASATLGNGDKIYHDTGSITFGVTYYPWMGTYTYAFTQSSSVVTADVNNQGLVHANVIHKIYFLWNGEEEQYAHSIGTSAPMLFALGFGELGIATKSWTGTGHVRMANQFVYFKATGDGAGGDVFSTWLRTADLPTQ